MMIMYKNQESASANGLQWNILAFLMLDLRVDSLDAIVKW